MGLFSTASIILITKILNQTIRGIYWQFNINFIIIISRMTFQDAIISVINDFGKDILSNASLQNFLNDYNAFDESKSFRVI